MIYIHYIFWNKSKLSYFYEIGRRKKRKALKYKKFNNKEGKYENY